MTCVSCDLQCTHLVHDPVLYLGAVSADASHLRGRDGGRDGGGDGGREGGREREGGKEGGREKGLFVSGPINTY